MHKIFILVQSNLSYIHLAKVTRAWLWTISKDLQSSQHYTFKICKNITQWFLNHTRMNPHNKTPLSYLENHQAQPKSLRKTKPQWWHSLSYHNHLLQASNTKQNASRMIQYQYSPATHCMRRSFTTYHSKSDLLWQVSAVS